MKSCPECSRVYADQALRFCLDDGNQLVDEAGPTSVDPPATIRYPEGISQPQPTIASNLPPLTPWSSALAKHPRRSVWPWILGGVALLCIIGVGLIVLVVGLATLSKDGNSLNGPISEGHMAKDNDGQPGDKTNTFSPSDRTVHCVVTLKEAKEGQRLKFTWWIVDAQDTKDEKLKDIEYTTTTGDNVVHGHLTWSKDWPSGKYKCEVDVNDNLEKTIDYFVK